MMLNPRLTNCVECSTVSTLLADIDCKITELAKNQYYNIIYSLGLKVPEVAFLDLLNYKRILTYRYYNEQYACGYTTLKIASKVKILIHK